MMEEHKGSIDQSFDWPGFKAKMHAELDRLENIYRNILKSNAVETFDRRAKLVGPHTVELDVKTNHIKIYSNRYGGRPALPILRIIFSPQMRFFTLRNCLRRFLVLAEDTSPVNLPASSTVLVWMLRNITAARRSYADLITKRAAWYPKKCVSAA